MISCLRSSHSLLPEATRLLQLTRINIGRRQGVLDAIRDSRFFCQPSTITVLHASRGYCTSLQRKITRPTSPGYLHHPRKVTAVALPVHGGARSSAYRAYHVETVPYTNRTHMVLFSPRVIREISERTFFDYKRKHASKIVDPQNRDTVRVNEIGRKIIGSIHSVFSIKSAGQKQSKKITHLEWVDELNWEMIVIQDDSLVECFPGGKIVVSTRFLNIFGTDAEIATVLAHEVGHILARHSVEMIKIFEVHEWFLTRLLVTPFLRRNETEADYIGILVLAAAGFDPHAVPQFFEKAAKIKGESMLSNLFNYFSRNVHPSCKKRSRLLSRPKVMEEAMKIYREAIRGPGA